MSDTTKDIIGCVLAGAAVLANVAALVFRWLGL